MNPAGNGRRSPPAPQPDVRPSPSPLAGGWRRRGGVGEPPWMQRSSLLGHAASAPAQDPGEAVGGDHPPGRSAGQDACSALALSSAREGAHTSSRAVSRPRKVLESPPGPALRVTGFVSCSRTEVAVSPEFSSDTMRRSPCLRTAGSVSWLPTWQLSGDLPQHHPLAVLLGLTQTR